MLPENLAALGLQVTNDAQNTPLTEQPSPQSQLSLNIPESLGQSIAQHMGPLVSGAVSHALSNTPINVTMPKMKRTPVRSSDGMIMHTIDEPMPEAPSAGNMVQ